MVIHHYGKDRRTQGQSATKAVDLCESGNGNRRIYQLKMPISTLRAINKKFTVMGDVNEDRQ